MSWTRSILLFMVVNVVAIALMVLPYYASLDAPLEIAAVSQAENQQAHARGMLAGP